MATSGLTTHAKHLHKNATDGCKQGDNIKTYVDVDNSAKSLLHIALARRCYYPVFTGGALGVRYMRGHYSSMKSESLMFAHRAGNGIWVKSFLCRWSRSRCRCGRSIVWLPRIRACITRLRASHLPERTWRRAHVTAEQRRKQALISLAST